MITFQGTLKSTKEKVGIKLEDPESEECYLPLEVQVYRDLQQSNNRSLFSLMFDYFKFVYFLQEQPTFWTKVSQIFMIMA